MERERNPGWAAAARLFPGFHFVTSGLHGLPHLVTLLLRRHLYTGALRWAAVEKFTSRQGFIAPYLALP